jgi:VWFA-related protein
MRPIYSFTREAIMKFRTALTFLLMSCSILYAQTPTPGVDQQPFTLTSRSTLVLVPALVRTHSGELVYTLTAKDFTLTDNGVEQKLSLEEDSGSQPIALVVAIQTGGAGARQFDTYRNLGTMVEAIVGDVPRKIAVVTFDSEPNLLQPFTPDVNVMEDAFGRLDPGNSGAAILDALAFSVDQLRNQPPEYRRAILLLSETLDNGSHVKLEDALRDISDTNTAIYSLAFSTSKSEAKHEAAQTFGGPPGPPTGCMGKDPNPDPTVSDSELNKAFNCLSILAPPLRLAKIAVLVAINGFHKNVPETVAHLTGGEYFSFNNTKSLERGLLTLSNHIPNRYVLSFHPQSPQPGIHAITLSLKEHIDLTVTARSSYWADTAPSTQPQQSPIDAPQR